MSRQDPGAATGQTPPVSRPRCTCGCLSSLHAISTAGRRAACSNSNCDCTRFTKTKEETP
jgi:hypothetical protein